MHLEILVEEPSAEEALSLLIPKIVGDKTSFAIHSFGDKQTLLREIGSRLKAYAQWMPADWRIVVLVDRDDDDCLKLKAKLELAAKDAGLPSKTVASRKDRVRVINRIAVEELEAWFFGDVQALTTAYPKDFIEPHQEGRVPRRGCHQRRHLGGSRTSAPEGGILRNRSPQEGTGQNDRRSHVSRT